MGNHLNLDWTQIRSELIKDLQSLLQFLRNPLERIRSAPTWGWPSQLVFLLAMSASSGALNGILSKSFFRLLEGIFILPLSSVIVLLIAAGFFYYLSLFLLEQQIAFKKLTSLLLLVSIPTFLMNILSPVLGLFAPILGLALSGLLLMVGLVENFKLPRRPIIKVVAGLYLAILILWLLNAILTYRETRSLEQFRKDPQSLDILERELRRGR